MFTLLDKELETVLSKERKLYLGEDKARIKQMKNSHNRRYIIWKYLVYFRKCQFWKGIREDKQASRFRRHLAKILFRYYDCKRNLYSDRCGVEICLNAHIGSGIDIWHGGIVINGSLGSCILHGNNINGNKGKGRENECPRIGNHVDIGAGVIIIGDVKIADGCVIGAGAVVTRSFHEERSVLAGVPAKTLRGNIVSCSNLTYCSAK